MSQYRFSKRHFVLLLLTLSGCIHTLSTEMERWVGKDESALISRWGAPDLSAPLPAGGKVLTWLKPWNAAEDGQPADMRQCRQSFTLSASGTVTKWAADGCPRLYRGR